MRYVVSLIAGLSVAVLLTWAFAARADAHHNAPTSPAAIERVYPDLHARELARERPSWNRLRKMARSRWMAQHPELIRRHRIHRLVRRANAGGYGSRQTASANRSLARLILGNEYACASRIIDGESQTWDHRIAYGFRYGTHLIYSGSAYGLGQARPGTKMLRYGRDAASNPAVQLVWFRAYAIARYGSICAASSQWSYARSW